MKKITVLICTLAFSVATFALVSQKPRELVEITAEPTFHFVQAQWNQSEAKAPKAAAVLDTVCVPYLALDAYNVGFPGDGLRYIYYRQGLISPYTDSLIFYNYEWLNSDWYINNEKVAEQAPYIKRAAGFGEFDLPLMKTATAQFGDTTRTYIDYQTAGRHTAYLQANLNSKFYNVATVAPATLSTITRSTHYSEDPRVSTDGTDWTCVGAGELGSYSYGSHLTNPWDGGYFDTIFVPFFQDGAMYIDNITLGVWTKGTEILPGENEHIRLNIYSIDDEGIIDWTTPLAHAVATKDNFTPYSTSYTWLGLLQFNFTDIDPVTGSEQEVPAIITGNFIVALDEFNNDSAANIGFISDFHNYVPGQTWFVGRDSVSGEQYVARLWTSPSNILLNLDVLLPAFEAPAEVGFPLDITTRTLNIPSNVWDEDIADYIESDDWITVDIETEYETEEYQGQTYYTHLYTNKLTITLDENAGEREGTISIDALGLPVTIKVIQGEDVVIEGIEDVVADVRNNNKTYNVLGQEVGEDYKGIVIRNGKKFVQ